MAALAEAAPAACDRRRRASDVQPGAQGRGGRHPQRGLLFLEVCSCGSRRAGYWSKQPLGEEGRPTPVGSAWRVCSGLSQLPVSGWFLFLLQASLDTAPS